MQPPTLIHANSCDDTDEFAVCLKPPAFDLHVHRAVLEKVAESFCWKVLHFLKYPYFVLQESVSCCSRSERSAIQYEYRYVNEEFDIFSMSHTHTHTLCEYVIIYSVKCDELPVYLAV